MKKKILTALGGCCIGLCTMIISPLPTFAADTIAITDQRATPTYWTKHTLNGDGASFVGYCS